MAIISLLSEIEVENEIETNPLMVLADVAKYFEFRLLLNSVDLADTTLEFSLALFVSDDNKEWRQRAGMTCVGGAYDWTEPPSLGVPTHNLKNKYVRIRFNTNKQITIGLEIEDRDISAIRSG